MDIENGASQNQQDYKIVTPAEILARMRLGTKDVHSVQCRGQEFAVRLLSGDKMLEVRRRAIAAAKKEGWDSVDKDYYQQKLTLVAASKMAENEPPGISLELLSSWSLDEVISVYEEYMSYCESVNPKLEALKPEEFRVLVDAVKKNNVDVNSLSLKQLRAIFFSWQGIILEAEKASSLRGNSPGGPS